MSLPYSFGLPFAFFVNSQEIPFGMHDFFHEFPLFEAADIGGANEVHLYRVDVIKPSQCLCAAYICLQGVSTFIHVQTS